MPLSAKTKSSRRPRRAPAIAGALAGAALLAGCAALPSAPQFREDARAERKDAYAEWTRDRDRSGGTLARVDGPLSIDDAIKVALQYNKPLQTILESKNIASAQALSAYQIALPSVTVSAGYQRWTAARNQPPHTPLDRYSAGFAVSQPLGQGALIPATIRRARLFQALADEDVRQAVEDVIHQTAVAYYDVVLAQEMVKVYKAALESADMALQVARTRHEAGTVRPYEVLRAQTEYANTESNGITQENNAQVATIALLRIMGVSQDSKVELTSPLEFLPMAPVFERAVELAFTNRPDLLSAEMNVRAQVEALRIAKSAWWPAFAATISQSYGRPNPGDGRDAWNHGPLSFGLDMGWVLNAAETLGRQRAEAARLRQQKIALLDAQDNALEAISVAIAELRNSEKLVNAQTVAQEAATESLRLAQVGYSNGATPFYETVNARTGETEAKGNYIQALYRHATARLALQVAMGVLGPRPGETTVPRELPAPPARVEEFMAGDPALATPRTTAAIESLADEADRMVGTPMIAPAAAPAPETDLPAPEAMPDGASAPTHTGPFDPSRPDLLPAPPLPEAFAAAFHGEEKMQVVPMTAAPAMAAKE